MKAQIWKIINPRSVYFGRRGVEDYIWPSGNVSLNIDGRQVLFSKIEVEEDEEEEVKTSGTSGRL